MKSHFKTIAAAAVFASGAASAQDADASYTLENSTLFASTECIENALRHTFGHESGIDIDVENGLIMANGFINEDPVNAEVYLGFKEAVASLHVTFQDGLAKMNEQDEFVAPPNGTATLYYRGNEGTPEYTLDRYDQKALEKYIKMLDQQIRACTPAMMLS